MSTIFDWSEGIVIPDAAIWIFGFLVFAYIVFKAIKIFK